MRRPAVASSHWASMLFVAQYAGYAVYVVFRGVHSPVSLALGIAKTPSLINLFILGLVAGSFSFGGAYTAIPFVQVEVVLKGGWLTQSVFIDCIAIGNVLPAPLVIFSTFAGLQGGLADGGCEECICWCGYHHARNVLPLLSLHDCRSFFAREVRPEHGLLLFTDALSAVF